LWNGPWRLGVFGSMHLQLGFPQAWYCMDRLPGCRGPSAIIFFFIASISLSNAAVSVLVFMTAKLASLVVIVNKESENSYDCRRRGGVVVRQGDGFPDGVRRHGRYGDGVAPGNN